MRRFHFITMALPLLALVACCQAQASEPFRKNIDVEGGHFLVEANDPASPRQLKITASGLKGLGETVTLTRDIQGTVTGAMVGNLDADGNPEIFVLTQSADGNGHVSVVAYEIDREAGLSPIYFPPIVDNRKYSGGYRGQDHFAVEGDSLVQTFPVYTSDGADAKRTGKERKLYYTLTPDDESNRIAVKRGRLMLLKVVQF
jgi:hypothetical protein